MKAKVRAKIWLEIGSGAAFCHGKAALLSEIRACGSIRQAALKLGMSYRRAWEYIRDIESAVEYPVVETRIGGTHGGGATLTPGGRDLLDLYETVHRDISKTIRAHRGTAV
jgi:molybdate transport system regulatory protein